MPPKVQQKSKEAKMAAAMAGGKSKKKKWSKGKVREKMANKVLFDEDTCARLLAEIPKMKLITPSALVERLKVNGALARAAIKELQEKGLIKQVSYHHTQWIFTRRRPTRQRAASKPAVLNSTISTCVCLGSMKVKKWPDSLPVEMARVGLDLCAPFSTKWYNDAIAEEHLKMAPIPNFGRKEQGALAYVVGGTRGFWQRFLRHYNPKSAFVDRPGNACGLTAFDAFVEEMIIEGLDRAQPPPHVKQHVYVARPLDADKDRVQLQRCAGLAGLCDLDPLTGLAVHPTYGAWVSLRAVVVFDLDGPEHRRGPARRRSRTGPDKARLEGEEQGATDYEDWHKVRCCLQRGEDHAFTDSQLLYYFVGDDPDRSKSLTKALRFQIT
ncbi:hypothetical protein JL722_6011 [Aureococcus anophagefferens]|nr:hypothetical protein JL722_6011 [Aureococcus anophagefferens]